MATPFSNPNLYFSIAPVDPTNWDTAFKALQYKQGQYDANKLKVDTIVQQYLSTDIIKPEVKQKFAQNINNLISEINAVGRTDFSDPDIANRVVAHIGQALDEPTLNAIAVSKQVRQQEGFLQELQQKKPNLYSNINHQDMYRRKGADGKSFNDWLQDGDANSVYRGSLQYMPFVDVDKKVNDTIMQLMKQNGNDTIELLDPTDPQGLRTIKKKISGLSEDQLRQIVQFSVTSPEDLEQLALNARARYNWYETPDDIERLKNDTENLVSPQLTKVSADIAEIEIKLKTTPEDSPLYTNLTQQLQERKNDRTYYTQLSSNLQSALSQEQFDVAASQVYNVAFSKSVVNKFLPLYKETFLGYGVDEYGKDQRDFNFNLQKEQTRQAERAEDIERKQLELEAQQQGQILVVDSPQTLTPQDFEGNIAAENSRLAETAISTGKAYLNNLESTLDNQQSDSATRDEAGKILQAYRYRLQSDLQTKHGLSESIRLMEGKSLSELMDEFDPTATTFSSIIDNLGGVELRTAISDDGTTNYASILKSSTSDYNYSTKQLDELEKQARKEVEDVDQTELLKAISDGDYKYVSIKDGQQKDLKQQLKTEGILSNNGAIGNNKLSQSKVSKDVEATFVATELLESITVGSRGSLVFSGRQLDNLKRLESILGDTGAITSTQVFGNSVGGNVIMDAMGNLIDSGNKGFYQVDPNSKVGKYLTAVNNSYTNAIAPWQSNQNIASDGKFKANYYGAKDYRTTNTWIKGIERIHGNLPSTKTLSVDSKSTEGQVLVRWINSNPVGGAKANPDFPIIIQPAGENEYQLFQQVTEDGSTTAMPMGKISKNMILTNIPSLAQRINWEQQKVIYDRSTTQNNPIKTKPIKYWAEYTPLDNANEITGGDPSLRAMLRQSDALEFISRSTQEVIGMAQTVDTELPTKLNNAINNSSNYIIQAKVDNRGLGDYVVLDLYDTKANKIVYTQKIEGKDYIDDIKPMLDQTPQILYTRMLQNIIAENYNRNITNPMFQINGQAYYTDAYKAIFK